jgi:hypothetical protein
MAADEETDTDGTAVVAGSAGRRTDAHGITDAAEAAVVADSAKGATDATSTDATPADDAGTAVVADFAVERADDGSAVATGGTVSTLTSSSTIIAPLSRSK